ncbi:MAG: hypothetical protein RSG77_18315 [Hafnia sp.]
MNIHALRDNTGMILPLLRLNLELADTKIDSGDLSCEGYSFVASRLQFAEDIINCDIDSATDVFTAAAMLTLDLRSVVQEVPQETHKLEAWLQFLRDSGMTGTNSLLDIPSFQQIAA